MSDASTVLFALADAFAEDGEIGLALTPEATRALCGLLSRIARDLRVEQVRRSAAETPLRFNARYCAAVLRGRFA